MKNTYKMLGSLLPDSYKEKIARLLRYAGINESEEVWAGLVILLIIMFFIIRLLVSLIVLSMGDSLHLGVCCLREFLIYPIPICLFLFPFVFYIHLKIMASIRSERAEEAFPDFLYNVSSNLKGGMTPLEAFFTSAKPQFPIIGEEAKKAYQKVIATGSLSEAFDYLADSLDSLYIRRFSSFFRRALMSGGKVANLLESYADYLRDMIALKKDLKRKTSNYVVFISIISIFIMPFLFALSHAYLLSTIKMTKLVSKMDFTSISLPIKTAVSISPANFMLIVAVYLVLSGILTAVLIALLRKGKMAYAAKYLPFVWLAIFIAYYVSELVVKSFGLV